jgi:hypothetical protein
MRRTRYGILLLLSVLLLYGTGPLAGGKPISPAQAEAPATLPPAAAVAAVYQPLHEHLEVFEVADDGALYSVWKHDDGNWEAPYRITDLHFAKPGASVAAVYYPKYEQLEAFVVDTNGALRRVWKAHDGLWNAPQTLKPTGFAPSGAPLAAVYQPINEQLEVFLVDSGGALQDVWKANNDDNWGIRTLSSADFAKPGASVAGIYYPKYEQLEVFVVDKNGVFNVVLKVRNGLVHDWFPPAGQTSAGFAPSGAPLAAVYQPINEQLEVFLVDGKGALQDIWKANNNAWGAESRSGSGLTSPAASVAAVYDAPYESLEVYVVAVDGHFSVKWKQHNSKDWNGPLGVSESHYSPGAPVAAVYYPTYDHVEAFTVDDRGVLNVQWKVQSQPWMPCGLPVMGAASNGALLPSLSPNPVALRSERIGQLTGVKDPENLPHLYGDELQAAGALGMDLGANTIHDDKRLYIFFGDTVPGVPRTSAARDTDLVGWSDDLSLRPGGFTLHPVTDGGHFDPFSVDSGVGSLPNSRTPVGAFSYGGKVYVFGLWNDPANGNQLTTIVASKADPSKSGSYHLEVRFSTGPFWGAQPIVVKNGEHHGLPESEGDGLVILALGTPNTAAHLAWLRLDPTTGPVWRSIRYYTGKPDNAWTPSEESSLAVQYGDADTPRAFLHENEARNLVQMRDQITSFSAAWLPDANRWIMLYPSSDPDQHKNYASPLEGRMAVDPWAWSDEFQVFNTCSDHGYLHFMHWPGYDNLDTTDLSVDPNPGHAYGAFVLPRFTSWDAGARELSLAYLMSTGSPYQVQVMRTVLHLPDTVATLPLPP